MYCTLIDILVHCILCVSDVEQYCLARYRCEVYLALSRNPTTCQRTLQCPFPCAVSLSL